MHVETAQANGAEFLLVPRSASSARYAGLHEHLRDRHRLVTSQRYVCEIWELVDQAEARFAMRNGSEND